MDSRPTTSPQPARTTRVTVLFYGIMGLIGIALILYRRGRFDFDPLALGSPRWPSASLATLLLIGTVHLLTRFFYARSNTLRATGREIIRFLGPLSGPQIAAVALASGIGEELLFRGWLYHETGLWLSSLLFGIIHFPPNRRWLYWPIFAFTIGLLLGGLYEMSESLLYPIALHAGINFLNLRLAIDRTT